MNDHSIQETRQRAYRYFYEDGVVEMAIGGFFAFTGAMLWLFQLSLAGGPYAWLLGVGLVLITGGGVFGINALITRIKRDVTYPRTGKVTYAPTEGVSSRWFLIIVTIALAAAAIWLPDWANTTAAFCGALLTLVLFYMGNRVGLLRLQLVAILPVSAGVLASYAGIDEFLGTALVFGASGLLMALVGTWAFANYVRSNQPADQEDN